MPGSRPDSSGPVWAVTAWRARTSRVTTGAGVGGPAPSGVGASTVGAAAVTSGIGLRWYRWLPGVLPAMGPARARGTVRR